MNDTFTPKQAEEIRALKNNEFKRINIYDGSVRSGKTWISAVIWVLWVTSRKTDGKLLMCAKTLTALKRNVLDLMIDIFGADNIQYSISQKKAYIFGKEIELEGANDARSESKIRGMTLQGAYCDELTLFPEDFFRMLLSRLSMPNAKLFATTNPDTPNHWLMRGFLDEKIAIKKGLNLRRVKFLIDDNTKLDSKYVEDLKNEYDGVFYDRFILGKWVVAEGAIYRIFSENHDKYVKSFDTNLLNSGFIDIGVDFGGSKSATAFTATWIAYNYSKIHVLETERHPEELNPDKLNRIYIDFIHKVWQRYKLPQNCFADSAEQVLIRGLRAASEKERIPTPIYNSKKKPINDRIRLFLTLMSTDRFAIQPECENLISALGDAVWDSKALDDLRLDDGTTDIDSLDSAEYSVETHLNLLMRSR